MPNTNFAAERPRRDDLLSSAGVSQPSSFDGLDAFDTETASPSARPDEAGRLAPPRTTGTFVPARVTLAVISAVCLFAALLASGVWAYRAYAVAPPTASLSLQSTPEGAEVLIDGQAAGVTPLSLSLAPGTYEVVLASSAERRRTMALTLKAGDSVVHGVEWAEAPAPVSVVTGGLRVQTEPPGQAVFVDDVRRGTSPLTISDLAPGEHRVTVTGEGGVLRRQVRIAPGETVSLVVAPNAPALSAGWLRVSSPVLLQVHAGRDLVGSSESDRVLLPAGDHEIVLSNDALGFSVTRRVSIAAGRTADVRVTPPNGTLSINAVPWAEVWIGEERLGETPLANLSRPIGTYTVTFRHPQFGERRSTVTVSAKEPARLGVDMRR